MARYVLEVMYDGTRFHGSQLQGNTPTVQLYVNNALSTLLRRPVLTVGASRTDEGVHALCNFYHFDEEGQLPDTLLYKCNAILPHGIGAKAIYKAENPEFNARFEAVSRRYRYRIYVAKNPFLYQRAYHYPYKIDKDVLQQAADIIKEYTQFESFSKRNTQSFTFNCHIHESEWQQHGDELHYVVRANRFLRGMVRGLVATQLHIARGRALTELHTIIQAQDCTKARFNVPGFGLYLEEITYPEGMLSGLVSAHLGEGGPSGMAGPVGGD